MSVKATDSLTIGLDIGIASVGWAVLATNRIVDMGVRAFDAAEDKDGKPHNQTRRGARVSRNRYDMRAWRLKKLARLFRDVGMLSNREIKQLFSAVHGKNQPQLVSPWQLRAEGLSRPLTPQEWAQVIYHLVKHRGFKFFSKTEDPTSAISDDEESASKKSSEKEEREGLRNGLEYTATLLKKYPQFETKTLGYAAYQLATARQDKDGIYRDPDGNRLEAEDCEEFQNAYRNKDKSYRHAFRRDDLMVELDALFDAQQQHGNPYAELPLPEGVERLSEVTVSSETRPVAPTFRSHVFAYFELQHPPITSGQMDAMIGDCELESEARNGKGKERRAAKHSFSNERATWLQTLNNLRIKRNGKPEDQLSPDERALLIDLPYTQTKVTFKQVRELLREKTGFPAHWREASFTNVSYRNKRKDDGSWINIVAADGTRKACDLAGYKTITFQRTRHLPPLQTYLYERIRHGREKGFKETGHKELRYKDLTNPVVARAFNQARLVLNALIDRHDRSPAYVHVELARDMAKPLKGRWSNGKYIEGRQDIQKKQEENRNKRASARKNFTDTYKINDPTGRQILKERLYREQQYKCLYTLEKLDLDRVVRDENYAQIDHIWPRSLTFDNSMENLVLVHAHANQDKGNRIPYDFVTQKYGAEHWRKVEAHVLCCKGMSNNKQKRVLAMELDADEFLARNLVDTRYATRLFARMVRDRLLFDGQNEDKIEDIDPSESGTSRLEKFHKSRVRTPQGGVVSFLRGKWLGDIKDRDAGDKHHAMDACIIAACTPELIHRVNSWFANEERVPSRFERNDNGTYTDRGTRTEQGTGEIISKQEARERGLYLPPPWDEPGNKFRNEFLAKYESVFVSRAVRKKRNVELHDANPMPLRYYPVSLQELTLGMLDEKQLPPDLPEKRLLLIQAIRHRLLSSDGDAAIAFQNGFLTKNAKGKDKIVHDIPLPLTSLPEEYLKRANRQLAASGLKENFKDTAKKNVPLNNLSLRMLMEEELGSTFYHRNSRLIEALKAQLNRFDDDAEKAFADRFYPFGKDRPFIRSIRLPAVRGSGIYVRGGVANLGDALYTEMYKHEGTYRFRARYKVPQEDTFGLPVMPRGAQHICNFAKNDFVRIKHSNLAYCYREINRFVDAFGNTLINVTAIFDNCVFEGYWNYFEPSNDRPVVQLHDGSAFFLLEDGKTLDKKTLTLIAKPKEKKKSKSQEVIEHLEYCEDKQEVTPLKFSLVTDIKRRVSDASFIEKVKINILGRFQES